MTLQIKSASLRHLAALVVGWYLISPPIIRVPRRGSIVNYGAHLPYWKIRGRYASFEDCEQVETASLMLPGNDPDQIPEDFIDVDPEIMDELVESMICVATDDPGLQRKYFIF
jgi:hypothetical protein